MPDRLRQELEARRAAAWDALARDAGERLIEAAILDAAIARLATAGSEQIGSVLQLFGVAH